jgi:hypothetical protein
MVEESEELLVKLRLLLERVPVQSLAGGFASVKIGVSAWPTGD